MSTFKFRPTLKADQHEQFRRQRLTETVRNLGQSSISPGEGMLELVNANGDVVGGLGDLPDGSFGIGLFRNGVFKNINDWFFDRGQIDSAFAVRDARLDQHDRNDASHQQQLTTLRGDITRLDAVDASIASQLGDRYTKAQVDAAFTTRDNTDASLQGQIADRYTKGQVDSAFSTRDGRIATAQNTANGAQSTANGAQSTANTANGRAGDAQIVANNAQQIASDVRGWLVNWANFPGRPPWNNLG